MTIFSQSACRMERLTAVRSPTRVVVADFQRVGAVGRLSDALAAALPGVAVDRIDPLPALRDLATPPDLPRLVDGAARRVAGPVDELLTVVADCGAAAVAVRIAQLLPPARPCRLVLVNPAWPTGDSVRKQFKQFQQELDATPRNCPDLADPVAALGSMTTTLRGALATAMRGLASSAPAVGEELLAAYRAWLAYLVAAAGYLADRPRVGPQIEVVLVVPPSASPGIPLDGMRHTTDRVIQPAGLAQLTDVVAALSTPDVTPHREDTRHDRSA